MPREKDLYQISLKLILKNENGEILILGGARGGTYEGYFDLPGGRIDTVEFNDPFESIIKRELQEEVGNVDVEINPQPVALGRHMLTKKDNDHKDVHVLYIFFAAMYKGGNIVISPEHTSSKWIDLKTIDPKQYFKSGILQGIEMYLKNDR